MKWILLGLVLPLIPFHMMVGSHAALPVTVFLGMLVAAIGALLESRKDPAFRRILWTALGGIVLCVASLAVANLFGVGFVIDQTLIPGSGLPRFFILALLGGAALVWVEIEMARLVLVNCQRLSPNIRPTADRAWKLYAITYALTKALTIGMVCVTVTQPADVFAADNNLLLETIMPFYIPAVVCEVLAYVAKIWLLIRLLDFFQKEAPVRKKPGGKRRKK